MTINKVKLRHFKSQLTKIEPSYSYLFKCPICLNDFNKEIELSNAHIFPEALGGKSKTITCSECDKKIGSSIEGSVVNHISNLKILSFAAKGKIRGKVLLEYNDVKYKTIIESNDNLNGLNIKLPEPVAIDNLKPISENTSDKKFTFQYYLPSKKINDNVARILVLKIAYYAAFDKLGYDYILNKELNWVREAIKIPHKANFPYDAIFYSKNDIMNIFPFKSEFAISPVNFDTICTPLFLSHHFLVFLPPYAPNTNNDFKSLNIKKGDHSDLSFNKQSKTLHITIKRPSN